MNDNDKFFVLGILAMMIIIHFVIINEEKRNRGKKV